MPHLDPSAPPARVAVFRALALGDMLCAVPALRALRAHLPDTHITLIGLPWAREFAARFAHYLDDFIAFPGTWGMPEQAPRFELLPGFLADVRARAFDLVAQMHGSGQLSNAVVADFGARQVIGYTAAASEAQGFLPWRDTQREALRWLDLLEACGVPPRGAALEFPLTDADHAELAALSARTGLDPARTVCVHPGARLPSRRWRLARFAAVAEQVAAAGYRLALTGSAAEGALTAALAARLGARALDLAGQTSLGGLAALISQAPLLIANDTGVSHIAAAVGTPSVIVASGSDVRRWAPLDRERHRVLHYPVPCRPCEHVECPLANHPCARGVTVEAVMRQVTPWLRRARLHA